MRNLKSVEVSQEVQKSAEFWHSRQGEEHAGQIKSTVLLKVADGQLLRQLDSCRNIRESIVEL